MTAPFISFGLDAARYLATGPDTTQPHGAKNDNTHCPAFVKACERIFPRPTWPHISFLDLGCAGGGLVQDFIEAGHVALGLDGSDWPQRNDREPWRRHSYAFYCCDVTYPFSIDDGHGRARFNVISAWEFMEHVPEERLPALFDNITRHSFGATIFTGSISTNEDGPYHVTVKTEEWWRETFTKHGWPFVIESPFAEHERARRDGGSFQFCAVQA